MGTARPNFYRDAPLFGLDIGHSRLKVMQIESARGRPPQVTGYGVSAFYPSDSTGEGLLMKYDTLGKALYDLLKDRVVGEITTTRVACTIPTSHTFSRPMKLPPMEDKDIAEAVNLEVEQYIPVPPDSLYLDYEISSRSPEGIEILVVATPKKIIDSYVKFLESMGLEPVALEPTMNAAARLFSMGDSSHGQPSILMDFGAVSTDVAVFDKTIFVNSTILGGSDNLSNLLAKRIGINPAQAHQLKNQHGITPIEGGNQEIITVIKPMLDTLVKEVQRIVRYYSERSTNTQKQITQIIMMGGGSNMPGLSEYLSEALKMPARMLNPWHAVNFGQLKTPSELEKSMYLTVAGEAILNPREIFA